VNPSGRLFRAGFSTVLHTRAAAVFESCN